MSRTIDPTQRLTEGFTPAKVSVGPDGASVEAVRPPSRLDVISLCQLGPCSHYHELVTKLDSQEPQDGSEPSVHVNTTRTCYPSAGIEMDISENPVRRCSLWDPRVDRHEGTLRVRASFMASAEGQAEWDEFEASWPQNTKEG